MDFTLTLRLLETSGNLRHIPAETGDEIVDLSSNDYLGLAARTDLRDQFLSSHDIQTMPMSASASRLLGARQRDYDAFESLLADAYSRPALLFNSGYHANTGLIQAIADKRTLIVADRLVHASIIDGIRLSGAPFVRFRHNDYDHLASIIDDKASGFETLLIIAESVYSMDGDCADIDHLIDIKRHSPVDTLLYIDEAHAIGVLGHAGLGLSASSSEPAGVDIIVGTLGKALASVGAYAILSHTLRDFMINKARSLIFSTALPPINIAWSRFIFAHMLHMDRERHSLADLSSSLSRALQSDTPSHIRPLIVGDPHLAADLSRKLLDHGFKVLPIRTPTVPPGTERLRFSLSADIDPADIDRLARVLSTIIPSESRH